MKIHQHLYNRFLLAKSAKPTIPLLLDSLRLYHSDYVASTNDGASVSLSGGKGEWFTLFENMVRKDYLKYVSPLTDGDVVIDIGANIGTFAIVAARQVGPLGKVVCYEPDPKTYSRLCKNIELNKLNNVDLVNSAVSSRTGLTRFYSCEKNAYSSLQNIVDGRHNLAQESFEIDSVAINDVLEVHEHIKLIKIDCEGSEYEILRSLTTELAARVDQIALEVHDVPGEDRGELAVRLHELGFSVRDGYPLVAKNQLSSS